ncbi:MAG: condensation domain-containing protein [Proteobacteria bacterium]|nr:condensation domain-containing protein [Pseudomonadota bacterium]
MPLTPVQRWFFQAGMRNWGHYNQSLLLRVAPSLDPGRLGKALVALVQRHDALRLRFARRADGWSAWIDEQAGGEPAQRAALLRCVRWPEPKGAHPAAAFFIEQQCAAFQTGVELEHGPLFRALHLDLGEATDGRLLLVAHHLLVDAISWRILLEELDALYSDRDPGPTGASFEAWARSLEALAQGPEPQRVERQHMEQSSELVPVPKLRTEHGAAPWGRMACRRSEEMQRMRLELSGVERETTRQTAPRRKPGDGSEFWNGHELKYWSSLPWPRPLPRDFPGDNLESSLQSLTIEVEPAETSNLLRLSSLQRVRADAVLLAALLPGLTRWCGQAYLLIECEGHGREQPFGPFGRLPPPDLSRTVGWFTCRFPVHLRYSQGQDLSSLLHQVHGALTAAPAGGVGYGVLRYLSPRGEELAKRPSPELSFNYLGQVDRGIEPGFWCDQGEPLESMGPRHDPESVRRHALALQALIQRGRLRLDWLYSQSLHRRSTIDRLASQTLDRLHRLARLES